jgi:hypothetical protein
MSTVQEIIDASLSRTNTAIQDANWFIDNLASIAGSWTNQNYNNAAWNGFGTLNVATGAPVSTSKVIDQSSALYSGHIAEASIPPQVVFSGINDHAIPDFTDAPVALVIPNRPEFVSPHAPSGSVNINEVNVSLGDKPTVYTTLTHDEPVISDYGSIDIGSYLVQNPEADYLVPTNTFSFTEQAYSSEFRDSLIEAISLDISGDGSGISPLDEQLLFERSRDREAATYKDASSSIARNMAARGFKVPPSAMVSLMEKAKDVFNKSMSSVNRDIMLKRSDLHVAARQFAINTGVTLDNAMLSYHGSIMERALNVSRFVAQFGIDYHNLQVQAFQDRLNVWKTVSDVKTQWVDNVLKKTKEYELRLSRMELIDKRNDTRTSLLNALNNAASVADNIRKAEIQLGNFQLENNRLKIEQSKLLTENYSAVMRGNDAAFNAYAAAIKAENLRNEPFALNLEKHKEQRATASNRLEIELKRKQSEIDVNSANLKRTSELANWYYKELDNSINVAGEQAKRINFDLDGWKMQLEAAKHNSNLNLDTQKAGVAGYLDTIRTNIDGNTAVNRNWMALQEVKIRASDSSLRVYEGLINGAQAALGTIATLSE